LIYGLRFDPTAWSDQVQTWQYSVDMTRATLVSQLQYACPDCWGYLKADERTRLQSIVSKAIGYNGYIPRSFRTLDELREETVLLIQV